MKKIWILLLVTCLLLVGCAKTDNDSSADTQQGDSQVSSFSHQAESSIPEAVPSVPMEPEEIYDSSTWQEYTCSLEGLELTIKHPSFLFFESEENNVYITCDPESPFYQYFPGRDGIVGILSRDSGYTKISDTEYEIPEVGQSLYYTHSTSLEPQTFFESGEYIVFMSGPTYFMPSIIYHAEKEYSLRFYFTGEPDIPVELFLQIASTIQS